MSALLQVTQADRDIAADWMVDREGLIEAYRARIQNGDWDKEQIVQIFARHRIACQAELLAALNAARAQVIACHLTAGLTLDSALRNIDPKIDAAIAKALGRTPNEIGEEG